jgi:hypothetical protein
MGGNEKRCVQFEHQFPPKGMDGDEPSKHFYIRETSRTELRRVVHLL